MYPASKIWEEKWNPCTAGCPGPYLSQNGLDDGSQPMAEYLRNWEHPVNFIAGVVRPNVQIGGGEWLQEEACGMSEPR